MQGSRCLVTGGAGLIGSHIVDLLVAEGVESVVVLDNLSRGRMENLSASIASGRVEFIQCDVRDRDALSRSVDGIDYVFHQAAIRITQCAEEPRLAFQVLAEGTFNVIEACARTKVRKVVAASSASVYGLAEVFPTLERHHPYDNRTIYGAAKLFNEGLLRSFNDMHGLSYVALRYFNVYGPRMDVHGAYTEVLVRWMERIRAGDPPLILGDGCQSMDFVYVTDVARANLLAAKADVSDEVFNIGSGTETTLLELATALLAVMGAEQKPVYGPARKVNPVPRRQADVQKAAAMLGFSAEISLQDGLDRLVRWWTNQQMHAS